MTTQTLPTETEIKTTQPPEQKVSRGEVWYNRLVYQGLNYWVNLGVSLTSADIFTNGAGRKQLDKLINGTEKLLLKTEIFDKAFANKSAKTVWKTMALTMGGWLAALTTKPLEDNKRPIVHWLNKKLGVDQTDASGRELKPDEIYIEKEQPHQTWLNVIKRRIIASGIIIGSSFALDQTVGTKNMTDTVTGAVTKGLKSGVVPYGEKIADNPVFKRYLGFAALDTFFAGVHAATMSLTAGARRAKMPEEKNDTAPAGFETSDNRIIHLPTPENEINLAEKFKKSPPTPMESHVAKVADSKADLALSV